MSASFSSTAIDPNYVSSFSVSDSKTSQSSSVTVGVACPSGISGSMSGDFFLLCSCSFEVDCSVPPTCSSPALLDASECEGGKGLLMQATSLFGASLLETIFGVITDNGNGTFKSNRGSMQGTYNYSHLQTAALDTLTRPDGSKCQNNTEGQVFNYLICPNGFAPESSSSSSKGNSSSSRDKGSSSSSEAVPSSSSAGELSSSSGISSSSDSDNDRPSSSSYGDSNVCLANPALKSLKKEANIYNDWVHMGREAYVTTTERRNFPRYPGKHFDALGRIYRSDRLPDISFYYFIDGNKIYKPRTVEEYSEFEVWKRIVKDGDGNNVQAFIKEDKRNGLRKDSSFYYNGYWEVSEIDSLAKSNKYESSYGIKINYLHDNKWRLTDKTITDKNDTLSSERYIWKNGRLAKTIFNGTERSFIYGKTLQDTVKVIPTDEWLGLFHSGFNNTAGKIPGEGDPMYEFFALEPYGYSGGHSSDGYEKSTVRSQNSVLLKQVYKITEDCGVVDRSDMPKAQCFRYGVGDIPPGHEKHTFYPGSEGRATYGASTFEFNQFGFECKCNDDGFFYAILKGNITIDEHIAVFFSVWYNNSYPAKNKDPKKEWEERCRYKNDMALTYEHEVKHVENARVAALWAFALHMTGKYKTEDECIRESQAKFSLVHKDWKSWRNKEIGHTNRYPPYPSSPTHGGSKSYHDCK
ncbi:MAG: hypothetical protein LBH25_06785 [Fibromonadaceae bacterium]|jgi:hypothetical protein|nr:hypothetical protein [Fibromonadaceae bacterium]